MRANYRNPPDDEGDKTVVQKVGKVIGAAAKLAAKVYVGKKVGEGLSDVGEGLKSDGGNPAKEQQG